jgi:hypothetical protein
MFDENQFLLVGKTMVNMIDGRTNDQLTMEEKGNLVQQVTYLTSIGGIAAVEYDIPKADGYDTVINISATYAANDFPGLQVAWALCKASITTVLRMRDMIELGITLDEMCVDQTALEAHRLDFMQHSVDQVKRIAGLIAAIVGIKSSRSELDIATRTELARRVWQLMFNIGTTIAFYKIPRKLLLKQFVDISYAYYRDDLQALVKSCNAISATVLEMIDVKN